MPKSKSKQAEVVRRDGGLCVTFVNSASAKRKSFETYTELLAWAQRVGNRTLEASALHSLGTGMIRRGSEQRKVLTARGCIAALDHAPVTFNAFADLAQPTDTVNPVTKRAECMYRQARGKNFPAPRRTVMA